jgi:hypothetical protein
MSLPAGRAQWRWAFVDRAAETLERPVSPTFTSRFDAEAWLGEHWRGLAQDRVASAQLHCGDDTVGGPVALREA